MSEIVVDSVTQVIVVDPVTLSVSVTNAGPQGPPGISGASSEYLHTQVVESDTWVINHNLGYRPDVSVTTVGGLIVITGIHHISNNQLQVNLVAPMAGYARLK